MSRDGGGGGTRKRNKMGLRNIVKSFNHRRAVRPGFSPTGAKRQMGSITALGGHTHDFHCYFNKREHRRGRTIQEEKCKRQKNEHSE